MYIFLNFYNLHLDYVQLRLNLEILYIIIYARNLNFYYSINNYFFIANNNLVNLYSCKNTDLNIKLIIANYRIHALYTLVDLVY